MLVKVDALRRTSRDQPVLASLHQRQAEAQLPQRLQPLVIYSAANSAPYSTGRLSSPRLQLVIQTSVLYANSLHYILFGRHATYTVRLLPTCC